MKYLKKTIVVGVGNTLRSDDGVGAFICAELEKINLSGLTVLTTHQLHIELVEDLKEFDIIIVVDAGTNPKSDVSFYPITEHKSSGIHSSHNIDATILYSLLQNLYPSERSFFVCEIHVQNFDLGDTISPFAIKNAEKSIKLLTKFIENE